MKKPIIPIEKADDKVVKALIDAGYLYVDDKGIHATEQTKNEK